MSKGPVEIESIPNRFESVVLAARRAKEIANGAQLTLPRNNHKDTVLALEEIARGFVSLELLRENIIKGYQHKQNISEDQPEDDKSEELREEMNNYSVSAKDIKSISNIFEDTDEDENIG